MSAGTSTRGRLVISSRQRLHGAGTAFSHQAPGCHESSTGSLLSGGHNIPPRLCASYASVTDFQGDIFDRWHLGAADRSSSCLCLIKSVQTSWTCFRLQDSVKDSWFEISLCLMSFCFSDLLSLPNTVVLKPPSVRTETFLNIKLKRFHEDKLVKHEPHQQ